MKISLKILLVILALIPFSIFAHSAGEDNTVVIHMTEAGYEPQDIEIFIGTTVVFESVTGGHWPASNIHPTHRAYPGSDIMKCGTDKEDGVFDSCRDLKSGETFSFTFNKVGVWRYHDHSSPNMKGKITVLPDEDYVPEELDLEEVHIEEDYLSHQIKHATEKILNIFGFSNNFKEGEFKYNLWIKKDSKEIQDDIDELYSYVRKFGVEQSMKQLSKIELEDQDTYRCHNMAHEVGRFAYENDGQDAFQKCSAECQSGCYHGAIEAHFQEYGVNNLVESLDLICTDDLNEFYNFQCFHGIGHGLMAWADYEIHEALDSCDQLPEENIEACYSGVFMENIVGGLAPELGHYTEYLNEDPHYPCNILGEKYKPMCYFFQTSRMMELYDNRVGQVVAECESLESPLNKNLCYGSLGRDISAYYGHEPRTAIFLCNEFVPEGNSKDACMDGLVQNIFWDISGKEEAINFCNFFIDQKQKNNCFETISYRAGEILNQEDRVNFCNLIQEEQTKNICLKYI